VALVAGKLPNAGGQCGGYWREESTSAGERVDGGHYLDEGRRVIERNRPRARGRKRQGDPIGLNGHTGQAPTHLQSSGRIDEHQLDVCQRVQRGRVSSPRSYENGITARTSEIERCSES